MNARTLALALFVSVGASLLVGCSGPTNQQPAPAAQAAPTTPPVAPNTPPPSGPPVSINAEMVALVDHAGHALWDAEREGKAPKTADDWAVIEEHATQLAAAGTLIGLPGTGPNDRTFTDQPDWQKFCRALSDAGLAAMKASEAKDMKALVAANGQLVEACEGCHKRFKPALPSEGINHRHLH